MNALAEFRTMRRRFVNCATHNGSDKEFAEGACEQYDATVAAVGELIEADRVYDLARRAWDDGRFTDWDGISDESRMKICADFEHAAVRRSDALARVGGAG